MKKSNRQIKDNDLNNVSGGARTRRIEPQMGGRKIDPQMGGRRIDPKIIADPKLRARVVPKLDNPINGSLFIEDDDSEEDEA